MKYLSNKLFFKTALCLSLGTLANTLSFTKIAQAQVGVSPLVVEVQENRSQAQGIINISNNSPNTFRARVYAEPFTYSRDRGFEILPSSPNDLRPYLQFSPRELTIPAGITRRIRFIVRFPPSLPDGEYQSVIFTQNLQEARQTDGAGNTVNITSRIGATVYVRKGNVAPNFSVEEASWNAERNQMQVLVRNSGQASAATGVNWTLRQGGNVVRAGTLSPSRVMADSERNLLLSYSGEGDSTLPPGNYQLSGEITWLDNRRARNLPFNVNVIIPANITSR